MVDPIYITELSVRMRFEVDRQLSSSAAASVVRGIGTLPTVPATVRSVLVGSFAVICARIVSSSMRALVWSPRATAMPLASVLRSIVQFKAIFRGLLH